MNIFALIPAYNADKHIARVIHGCVEHLPRENVIVVDDGSTDRTRSLIEQSGATVIVHDNNRGKGAALRSGFSVALKYKCDMVITLDADMQHDPKYLPEFIEAAEEHHDWDIIIGTRRRSGSEMPWDRRLSNKWTSILLSRRTGQKISDSQSGYRLIRRNVLENVVTKETGFIAESELLIKSSMWGNKIGSIDIPTIYSDEGSHINKFRDSFKFISLYFRSFFW